MRASDQTPWNRKELVLLERPGEGPDVHQGAVPEFPVVVEDKGFGDVVQDVQDVDHHLFLLCFDPTCAQLASIVAVFLF